MSLTSRRSERPNAPIQDCWRSRKDMTHHAIYGGSIDDDDRRDNYCRRCAGRRARRQTERMKRVVGGITGKSHVEAP